MSSQAAQPSSTDSGRLIVQRSPTLGSNVYLRLSIDGEVHNIGPGSLYDQPIPAGQHVLTLDTPSNQHQPTSMSLTVEPGQTYAFTATRGSDQGVFSTAIETDSLIGNSLVVVHCDLFEIERRFPLHAGVSVRHLPWPQKPKHEDIKAVAEAAVTLRALRQETMRKLNYSLPPRAIFRLVFSV